MADSPLSEAEQIRDRMRIEIAGRDAEIERLLKQLMEETATTERLRVALSAHFVGPWELTRFTDLNHVTDCECEQADGYTVDEQDPRCTEVDSWPALVLMSGEYHGWVLRLDGLEKVIDQAHEDDCDDGETARRVAAWLTTP